MYSLLEEQMRLFVKIMIYFDTHKIPFTEEELKLLNATMVDIEGELCKNHS